MRVANWCHHRLLSHRIPSGCNWSPKWSTPPNIAIAIKSKCSPCYCIAVYQWNVIPSRIVTSPQWAVASSYYNAVCRYCRATQFPVHCHATFCASASTAMRSTTFAARKCARARVVMNYSRIFCCCWNSGKPCAARRNIWWPVRWAITIWIRHRICCRWPKHRMLFHWREAMWGAAAALAPAGGITQYHIPHRHCRSGRIARNDRRSRKIRTIRTIWRSVIWFWNYWWVPIMVVCIFWTKRDFNSFVGVCICRLLKLNFLSRGIIQIHRHISPYLVRRRSMNGEHGHWNWTFGVITPAWLGHTVQRWLFSYRNAFEMPSRSKTKWHASCAPIPLLWLTFRRRLNIWSRQRRCWLNHIRLEVATNWLALNSLYFNAFVFRLCVARLYVDMGTMWTHPGPCLLLPTISNTSIVGSIRSQNTEFVSSRSCTALHTAIGSSVAPWHHGLCHRIH